MKTLVGEFLRRTEESIKNKQLNDYDGTKVHQNMDWMSKETTIKVKELHERYRHMFNNVNHQLSEAIDKFASKN